MVKILMKKNSLDKEAKFGKHRLQKKMDKLEFSKTSSSFSNSNILGYSQSTGYLKRSTPDV